MQHPKAFEMCPQFILAVGCEIIMWIDLNSSVCLMYVRELCVLPKGRHCRRLFDEIWITYYSYETLFIIKYYLPYIDLFLLRFFYGRELQMIILPHTPIDVTTFVKHGFMWELVVNSIQSNPFSMVFSLYAKYLIVRKFMKISRKLKI